MFGALDTEMFEVYIGYRNVPLNIEQIKTLFT